MQAGYDCFAGSDFIAQLHTRLRIGRKKDIYTGTELDNTALGRPLDRLAYFGIADYAAGKRTCYLTEKYLLTVFRPDCNRSMLVFLRSLRLERQQISSGMAFEICHKSRQRIEIDMDIEEIHIYRDFQHFFLEILRFIDFLYDYDFAIGGRSDYALSTHALPFRHTEKIRKKGEGDKPHDSGHYAHEQAVNEIYYASAYRQNAEITHKYCSETVSVYFHGLNEIKNYQEYRGYWKGKQRPVKTVKHASVSGQDVSGVLDTGMPF